MVPNQMIKALKNSLVEKQRKKSLILFFTRILDISREGKRLSGQQAAFV